MNDCTDHSDRGDIVQFLTFTTSLERALLIRMTQNSLTLLQHLHCNLWIPYVGTLVIWGVFAAGCMEGRRCYR
jgi:hypothetical protein